MTTLTARIGEDLTRLYVLGCGRARRIRQQARARRAARAQAVLGAFLLLMITSALAAFADDKAGGNPYINSFAVKDSSGLSIDQYELSIGSDAGMNPISGAVQGTAGLLLGLGWDCYRLIVSIVLWLFDFAVQFKLLEVMRPLAEVVATVLGTTMGKIGLIGSLTIIGFIFAVRAIGSGKTALGIAEIFVVILFSWAATSPIANPVTMIAGGPGQDGWLRNAADTGVALSAQITSGGENTSTDPATLKAQTTGKLVDIFIRAPHQLINYGAVIDKDETCKKVYDEVLKAGPYGDDSTARDKMGDCNEAYKKVAEHPQSGLIGLGAIGMGAPVLLLVASVLALGLTFLTLLALYESATFVVDLVKGIIPGVTRSGALESAGVVMIVCITIVVDLFAVGVFDAALTTLFKADTGWNPLQIFVVIDLILVVALIWLGASIIKAHRAGKKWGERASKSMSPSAQSVTNQGRANPVGTAAKAVVGNVGTRRAMRSAMTSGGLVGAGTGAAAGAAAARRPLAVRATAGAFRAAGTTAKVAAMSTIGAPVYVPRAAAATKSAMTAKLATAKAAAAVKRDDAKAFGQEYAHNVSVAARTVSRVSGAAKLAHVAAGLGAGPVAAGALAGATLFARSSPSAKSNEGAGVVRPDERAPHRGVPAGGSPAVPRTSSTSPRPSRSSQGSPTAPGRTSVKVDFKPPRTPEQERAVRAAFLQRMRERQMNRPAPTRIGEDR